ncbi:TlyA family RNA methyltransferase [Candidatus Saccharibacteria bacterium]|jgi:23S rRNA (cytidine1920-2'-O)/16S rRNA (cytidine1409-2'-O)-methyltransferase|nr:TlyA family RNA methyltransferase [Candidatus Saccharibacteria bacterium]HOR23094.1 TlyA family RNA methyltransferase [Candidatus Saccharibacteria bacterium]HPW47718.1 TlyA family RNA methyltransferase [Candidatus Saccharibacteria bacterium]
MKNRLDTELVQRNLAPNRSQAEILIRLGKVEVDGKIIIKPGYFVKKSSALKIKQEQRFVSRAALKLESVAETLNLNFEDKIVLDVGSSTGGFTDFALQNGAKKVIAVDVGTNQMHPSLRAEERVELHEKTDIRDFLPSQKPDIVLIDVSFISLRRVLPHIRKIITLNSLVIAMLKPQFEVGGSLKHRGVIKNDAIRRRILKDFEAWVKKYFVVLKKADSQIAGSKGNRERFFLLRKL